ncbi:MAG: hypothetical protein ACRCTR_08935 [Actinomycetota bacterium]
MTSYRRRFRRPWIAASAVPFLVAGSVALVGAKGADGALSGLSLKLSVASKPAVVENFDGILYGNLGVHLSVGMSSPLEVRLRRASYQEPLKAEVVITTGTRQQVTSLPSTVSVDMEKGLQQFFRVRIYQPSGNLVADLKKSFCPTGRYWGFYATSEPSNPQAPEKNPYPVFCSAHPFAFGTTMGLQRGWLMPVEPNIAQLDLPVGNYDVRMEVTPAWQSALKLVAADVTTNFPLKVVQPQASDPGLERRHKKQAQTQEREIELSGPLSRAREAGQVDGLPPTGNRTVAGGWQSALDITPNADRPVTSEGVPTNTQENQNRDQSNMRQPKPSVPKDLQPDLRSLPAFSVDLIDSTSGWGIQKGRQHIAFGATVWNAGPGPLVVDGFRATGSTDMTAYQVFFDRQGRKITSTNRGTLTYEPQDSYWNLANFASYQLLSSRGKQVAQSEQNFNCLLPTDAVDLTVLGADWQPGPPDLFTECGSPSSRSLREVLKPGWGTTHGQYVRDRSFDITDLPNGSYYIQILANPGKNLIETNTQNNESRRQVILGGSPGARTITVPPHEGLNIP